MSHVDEGTLHALLDGALAAADTAGAERVELHLAACPDCRARLEEAARLRDEASALLGTAQPRAYATPSFEAIRARAATLTGDEAHVRQEAGRRPRRLAFLATPFNGFAWAASVVFAVGLGWLLHDSLGDPRALDMREAAGGLAESSADAPPAQDLAVAEESAPAPGVNAGAAFAQDARAQSEPRAAARAPQEAAAEEVAPRDAAPSGLQAAAPPPAPPPASPSRRLEAPSRAEYDVEAERIEAADAAGAGAVTGDYAAAPEGVPLAMAADGWRAVTPAELDDLTGGELARLEDATLLAAATRGTGAGLEVRTVQRTQAGEVVTLVQRRSEMQDGAQRSAAAAQAERPALESATPDVTVRHGDWSVTISAPVARARLDELADDLH